MNGSSGTELLEIYKLHAELADRVSQRREAANRLHLGLLSGLSLFAGVFADFGDMESLNHFVFLAAGSLGPVISSSWWIVIRSHRQLNSAKFRTLHELEDRIAFPFFRREWEILKKGTGRKTYWKITTVETFLPIAFGILSAALIIALGSCWAASVCVP
ncbi:MAG: hypothetical protein OXC91_07190 [Rhodobacteraceae bacterium]|nr:hypothetical protein [Paracoccaceae bacterium]